MRAARTPPDPAPITNRSTSCAAIVRSATKSRHWSSQVVAFLLHLGAKPGHDLVSHLFRPFLGPRQPLVDDGRFLGDELLSNWRLVERDHLFHLGFGEALCIKACDLVDDLV